MSELEPLSSVKLKITRFHLRGSLFPRASERRVLLIVGVCEIFSHLHIFTSSHETSSHLHIFSSSHPHMFTPSHLHIFSSSHPHMFTSSHLHICSSSHLLLLTSSHPHILPSCSLALFLSCPLALFFFSISLLKARCSANETARNATLSHEMTLDRQKLR